MKPFPIAVLCSDLHLSDKCPIARTAEDDWFQVMSRSLEFLRALGTQHRVPVICAGDVFDKWNPSPHLINFALEWLPAMYSIPGQHDLPNHNYQEIGRSAYGVLEKVGRLKRLSPDSHHFFPIKGSKECYLRVWGFPWGFEVSPHTNAFHKGDLNLAVIHKYIWKTGCGYHGASEESRVSGYKKALQGYDVAVFGDNHSPFLIKPKESKCLIFNHGTMIRRKIDEIEYKPAFGLLMSDGTIELAEQDTSADKWIAREKAKKLESNETELKEFARHLAALGDSSIDFRDALKMYFDNNEVTQTTRKLLLQALDS